MHLLSLNPSNAGNRTRVGWVGSANATDPQTVPLMVPIVRCWLLGFERNAIDWLFSLGQELLVLLNSACLAVVDEAARQKDLLV